MKTDHYVLLHLSLAGCVWTSNRLLLCSPSRARLLVTSPLGVPDTSGHDFEIISACSICKAGLKDPSAVAGYLCDNGEGVMIGDSNGHPDGADQQLAGDEATCVGQGGTWKPYTCQDMQNWWHVNYQKGMQF